jgi:hypothetical protein
LLKTVKDLKTKLHELETQGKGTTTEQQKQQQDQDEAQREESIKYILNQDAQPSTSSSDEPNLPPAESSSSVLSPSSEENFGEE